MNGQENDYGIALEKHGRESLGEGRGGGQAEISLGEIRVRSNNKSRQTIGPYSSVN